jgi:hypothetical protein
MLKRPDGCKLAQKLFDTVWGPDGMNTVVQILILASARIVCNIVYVKVRDRIHREMVKYWCLV